MPEERGSIYKTTANEIGEALKAKLGGEGFAPKDWSDNLNLLGIASEDTEAAINSLKESEGSGERGSILLSTANAVGAMLNKKYNSQRGFSPAEWASATRKMKALETDAKSGGIVNLKGAKEVPITSLVGTVNPTLEGTDTLTATRLGKNLANFVNEKGINASGEISIDSKRCATIDFIPIKSGVSYKVYAENNVGFILAVFNGNTLVRRVASIASGDTLDTSGGDKFRLCIYGNGTYICTVEADKPRCLTSDDLDTSYTPYVAPTTYTANLGRTIYGGSADIVKGEGEENCSLPIDLSSLTWTKENNHFYSNPLATLKGPVNNTTPANIVVSSPYVNMAYTSMIGEGTDKAISLNSSKRLYIYDSAVTTTTELETALSGKYLVGELAASSDFTFDPIPINTSGDTENFYTSNGDTSITYYEEPTPYTRGSASGMIASIPEANTEFPFTKLKATIAPSVEGVSSVVVKNEGKNFIDDSTAYQFGSNYITIGGNLQYNFSYFLKAGTYTISLSGITAYAYIRKQGTTTNTIIKGKDAASATFTLDSDGFYAFWLYNNTDNISVDDIEYIQVEVGSSATEYTAYKNPTTYTAELGETVFGGSVDLVSGEVIGNEGKIVLDNSGWTYYPVSGANTFNKIIPFAKVGGSGILDGYNFQNVQYISQQPDKSFYFFASGTNARISIRDDSYTNANDFAAAINNKALLFELATPTEASIEPQEIYPNEGVNNIWNDANGITEVGYFGE